MHLRHLMRPAAAIVAAVPLCLLTGTGTVSAAPPADESLRPACTDILDGSGALTTASDGTGTLAFGLGLAAPACRQITYTVTVVDSSGATQMATTYTVDPDGTLVFTFGGLPVNTIATDGSLVPDDVCVSATTTVGGRATPLDRAPDTLCMAVSADGAGATNFH